MPEKEKKESHLVELREERMEGIHSKILNRSVDVNLLIPQMSGEQKYPLLLLNDGQDMEALAIKKTITDLISKSLIKPIIVAGVVAGDRLQEYGVSSQKDYLKRGSRAKAYAEYVTTELLPYLIYKYPVEPSAANRAIAGCSMGGLSAVDIAWNNASLFERAGAFSGSFWWRKRNSQSSFYSEQRDRIIHNQIKSGNKKENLKFWFQTGTQDESSDRNKNGVIDSIDDTLDLIVELTKKGYRPFHDIQYYEVKDGKHNLETWREAMPEFLKWAFEK